MELIGKLKQKVENAADREEARELIEEAGVKLTDEELDQVSGGDFLLPWRNPDDELGQEVVDQKQSRWDPKLP